MEVLTGRPPEPFCPQPVLPRRPLFSGALGFPFAADTLAQTTALVIGAVVVKAMIEAAIWLGAVPVAGILIAGPPMASMLLAVVGGFCC